MLYHQGWYTISGYTRTMTQARIRSHQEYCCTQVIRRIPTCCIPANILVLPEDIVHRKSIGPPLASPVKADKPFWGFLCSLGGDWMWDHVQEGEINVTWISAAFANGSFIGVTDGLYDQKNKLRQSAFRMSHMLCQDKAAMRYLPMQACTGGNCLALLHSTH
jgi:hypothetical protein